MLAGVGVSDDVRRAAAAAERYAAERERVDAVLAAEPVEGERIYVVAFSGNGAARSWLALDGAGRPVTSRDRVREAVSIAAMVEVVEDTVADGAPEASPRIASPRYLDTLGAAAGAELSGAIQAAILAVEELAKDVEANYKLELT